MRVRAVPAPDHFISERRIHFSNTFPLPVEKPRGGLLHPHAVLGAGPPDADPLRHPQHGAASALLQPAQPGVHQQGQLPHGPRLRPQPRRRLLPRPQGGPQTGEPESLLESSSTEHRGNGGKGLSRRTHQDVKTHTQGGGRTINTQFINTSEKSPTCTLKNKENTNRENIVCTFFFCIYDYFTF